MEVEEIIQKWFTISSGGEIDGNNSFFRFIALWVAFNALYTSKYGNERYDWEQIENYVGEPEVVDRHRRLMDTDNNYRQAVEWLKERGVFDLASRRPWHVSNPYNLTTVAKAVYKVRCNLFHGGKMPGNSRDERLVSASYTIISKLIAPDIAKINM